jgi:UDP-N-acetyl-D-mannosaminuronate dehydrogenase
VVIATDHDDVDYEMIRRSGVPVVDTRHVMAHTANA